MRSIMTAAIEAAADFVSAAIDVLTFMPRSTRELAKVNAISRALPDALSRNDDKDVREIEMRLRLLDLREPGPRRSRDLLVLMAHTYLTSKR